MEVYLFDPANISDGFIRSCTENSCAVQGERVACTVALLLTTSLVRRNSEVISARYKRYGDIASNIIPGTAGVVKYNVY